VRTQRGKSIASKKGSGRKERQRVFQREVQEKREKSRW